MTTSTACTGSSRSRSRCRRRTTPTTRRSPARPVATRRPCSTCWSMPGARSATLGATVRTARCGAFDDDLEVARGWKADPDGTDTAPAAARFSRANPEPVRRPARSSAAHAVGLEGVRDGAKAGVGATLERPRRAHDAPIAGDPAADDHRPDADLPIRIRPRPKSSARRTRCGRSSSTRTHRRPWSGRGRVGASMQDGTWKTATIPMDAFAGETVRIRFVADDGGTNGLVEVEIDDVRVTRGDSYADPSPSRHGPGLDSRHEVLHTKPETVPSPADALPGRSEPIMTPGIHRVLGTPLAGPWPEGTKTAIFGLGCFWGDEKDFWQLPGVVTTAVGYAGGRRRTRPTRRSAPAGRVTPRSSWSPTTRRGSPTSSS